MQLVEIAKALSLGREVLLLDEPTASLTGTRPTGCTRIVRRLRDDGVTRSCCVSHKLEEVFAIADR